LIAELEVPSNQAGYEQLLGAGGHRLLRRGAGQLPGRSW
jgi:hypothetical protein